MNVASLLASLRDRLVEVFEKDNAIRVQPDSSLSDEERSFIQANAGGLLAALRAPVPEQPKDVLSVPLDIEQILREDEERAERRLAAEMAPPPKVVMFRTANGFYPLRLLTPEQVRRFAAAGKLTRDEVIEWSKTRRS